MRALDSLERHLDRLEQLLLLDVAEREHVWSAQLSSLLDRMEQALRWHKESNAVSDELVENPDLIRLSRRFEELCHEYQEFLSRVTILHQDAKDACRAFRRNATRTRTRSRTPVAGAPDFEAIRQEVHRLLTDFRKHAEDEAALVLEGATTDIGAGD
jgi:hypothetical protein